MAAGQKLIASNLKLEGYLELSDNPIYLGLSNDARIATDISELSLNIINISGEIKIDSDILTIDTFLTRANSIIKYNNNYHHIYDDRTLVDKEYVDNQISLINNYWDLETSGQLTLNPIVLGPVVPYSNNLIDLGSSTNKWKNLFLDGYINKVNVNNAYTLPINDGLTGQVLKTDGFGNVSWQNDNNINTLSDLNDVEFATGEPNEGDILYFNGSNWVPVEMPISFVVSASTNSIDVTNRYLESDGSGLFQSPFILPENCILKYISASSANIASWTAEVHVNGTPVSGAELVITSNNKGYIKFEPGINFNEGDEVQLYVNGTSISKPRINAFFCTKIF